MPAEQDHLPTERGPLPALAAIARIVRQGIIVAPIVLTGCHAGVVDPKGPIAVANLTILIDSLMIMLAIVVPVIVATLGFSWWFRATNTRARYLPEFAYSGRLELIVWSIPLLTITLLGGVAWIGAHELDPATPLASTKPPVDIQVVSMDWKWLFIYPGQHVASVNRLVVPVGTPVHFVLTSASVMSVFFVPQLGSMIYTMNGMATQLNLQADTPGGFHGLSAHYNGDGFSDMHFDVQAVPTEAFNAWIATARGSGPTLNAGSYTDLARQSMNVAPFSFRDVDPDLFKNIVTQRLPPAPGPESGTPDPSTSFRTEH